MSKQLFYSLIFISLFFSILGRPDRLALKRTKVSDSQTSHPWKFLSLTSPDRFDLDYPYFARADVGDDSGLMAISLFNSHIFLSNCPSVFKYFNCSASRDTCIPFVKLSNNADYPYYSVSGYRINVNMSLGNYGRGNMVKALYADQCTRNSYNNPDVMGSVGLSINESNTDNFDTQNSKFSIWLERDGSDGELIFGEDSTYETDEPSILLNGINRNWEISISSLSLLDNIYDFNGLAIIDINSNFIGIPDRVHWQVMKDLKHRFDFVCVKQMATPNCTFAGDINSLPNLIFRLFDNDTIVTIPPRVYTQKIDNNLYRCLLVSLTKNPIDAHQLPVTNAYKNYIVLGAPFLQYYYTVFNFTDKLNPQIRLFVPNQSVVSGLSAWAIIGIILGALLLIGIIVGAVMAFKKNREKKRQDSLVNPESRVGYVGFNQ